MAEKKKRKEELAQQKIQATPKSITFASSSFGLKSTTETPSTSNRVKGPTFKPIKSSTFSSSFGVTKKSKPPTALFDESHGKEDQQKEIASLNRFGKVAKRIEPLEKSHRKHPATLSVQVYQHTLAES